MGLKTGPTHRTSLQRSCSDSVRHRQIRIKTLKPTHAAIIAWHILAFIYYLQGSLPSGDAQSTDGHDLRLLDLSHTFDESTIYWVTAKRLNFTVTFNGTDPRGDFWYQADEISAATHGGTHMDAPCHFAMGRWCISDIPPSHLVASAVVVDISNEVRDDPDVHLTADHLQKWELSHGEIPDNSLLLVRTGWSRFWPDPLTYTGTTERNVSLLKFPSIRPDAARWLVTNRNVVGVGIDAMSVDIPTGRREVHVALMERNIYALENVNLEDPLLPVGVKIYALPMKLKSASGAPCRILAEVPKRVVTGGNTGSSISQFWTLAAIAVLWAFKTGRLY